MTPSFSFGLLILSRVARRHCTLQKQKRIPPSDRTKNKKIKRGKVSLKEINRGEPLDNNLGAYIKRTIAAAQSKD